MVLKVCLGCARVVHEGPELFRVNVQRFSIQLHKRAEMESALGKLCRGLSLPVGGVFLGDLEGGGRIPGGGRLLMGFRDHFVGVNNMVWGRCTVI